MKFHRSTFFSKTFFIFLGFIVLSHTAFAQLPFITTWKTDNPGSSSNTQITIPTVGDNPNFDTYDYDIYWEEVGNPSNNGTLLDQTNNTTIDFPSAGIYEVRITGVFPYIFFNYAGDAEKILTIEQWGDINWQSFSYSFAGCSNLTIPATDAPDLTNVTSTARMFANATSFNEPINHWNTSTITTINFMFAGASSFNQPLDDWDVSNVTSVNGLDYMFSDATSFNQDLSTWEVSNVKSMTAMFRNATSFNQDIGGWDVSSVTSMDYMFNGASAFNQDISGWSTTFSASSVGAMFWEATSFNQPLNDWNMTNVTSLVSMFRDATAFDQPLGSWDISNVTNMNFLFEGSALSISNYDQTLDSWSAQTVQSGVILVADGLSYSCEGLVARRKLTSSPNNWDISGDTKDCVSFDTTWKTDNPGTSSSTAITIPTTGTGYNYAVVWEEIGNPTNNGVEDGLNDGNMPHTVDFGTSGNYKVSILGDFPRIYFNNSGDKEKLLSIDRWSDIAWTSMERAFYGCNNLTIPATDSPDLSTVTNMYSMLRGATSFNQDISGWDVSNVTNMAALFYDASAFDQDISGWDVSSVTDMAGPDDVNAGMFRNATSFNQDISGWEVGNVEKMFQLFNGATSFDQNLGNWDITSVDDMSGMLSNSGLSKQNYDATLIGWATQTVQTGVTLAVDGLIYCTGAQARQTLVSNSWDISGDTEDCLPFITTWQSDNPGDTEDDQVNVNINAPSDVDVYWEEVGNATNNGTLDNQTSAFTLTFPTPGTYEVTINGNIHGLSFDGGDKEKLLSIEQWGENQWTSMMGAFSGCNNLVINATDVPDFTFVTHTSTMFKDNINFNSDIGDWDMSNVVDMSEMFMGATSFNQNLNDWVVSSATSAYRMFANASSFNEAVDQWDVSGISSAFQMFEGATAFNQPIGNWNTVSFTDTYNMFNGADNFDQDLSNWDLTNMNNMANTFDNSGMSEENYDNTLIGWANNPNTASNVGLGASGLTYCLAADARDKLVNDLNWLIQGDLNSCLDPFISTWKTDNEGTSGDNQITIPINNTLDYLYEVYWENVNNSAVNGTITEQTDELTITFPEAGTYRIEIKDVFPAIQIFNGGDRLKILTIEQWGEIKWESMEHAFWGASNLVVNATDAPDLSNVSSLRNMFRDADSFNGDLNHWDLANVTDIQYMFTSTDSFTGSIDEWDVSNVENFSYLFAEAIAFDSNLANWDISSATTLNGIFDNCGLSYQNYDNTLIGWSELATVPSSISMGARDIYYCDGESARNILIDTYSWAISNDIKGCPQAITFSSLGDKTYGDADFELTASSDSGLEVAYESTDATVATVNGSTLTIVGAGSTDIIASQAGGDGFAPADDVIQSLVVNKSSQSITFNELNNVTFGSANFDLNATASSGLVITYESSNENIATVSGEGIVSIIGAGTCTITAMQAGDNNYLAAPSVEQSLTVLKAEQVITFTELPSKVYGDSDFSLSATINSDLPLTYESSNENVAVVTDNSVNITGVGATTISVNQGGDNNHFAAEEVVQSLVVNQASITITADDKMMMATNAIPDLTYTLDGLVNGETEEVFSSAIQITTEATSESPAGEYPIEVSGAEAANYSFNYVGGTLTIEKMSQTIDFIWPADKTFGDPNFELDASASSGLDISFESSDEAIIAIEGNQAMIIGAGTVQLTASQLGNDQYEPAESVTYEVIVQRADQTISAETIEDKIVTDEPFEVIASASSGLDLTYEIIQGPASIESNLITLNGEEGIVIVRISQDGGANYQTVSIDRSFTVLPNPCDDFAAVAANIQDVRCNGESNGSFNINPSGGSLPYTYTIGGEEFSVGTFLDMPAGSYEVFVSDFNGCEVFLEVEIAEADVLSLTSDIIDSTDPQGNGQISVTVSGGTGSYTYNWDNGENTAVINNLEIGEYTLTVTDENGCTLTETFNVGGITSALKEQTMDISLFPNPTRDIVHLHTGRAIQSIKLFNLTGSLVHQQKAIGTQNIVEIRPLPSGIYLMQIDNNKQMYKLIKK